MLYQHWKIMFLTKVSNQSNNFQKLKWIIFFYIIFHYSPKISYKNITYNPTFWNLLLIFHNLWQVLFWSKYIHHMQSFHLLLIFWEELLSKVSNFSKSPWNSQYFHQVCVLILSKFWNVKNCSPWQQFWGTLMCLCPENLLLHK